MEQKKRQREWKKREKREQKERRRLERQEAKRQEAKRQDPELVGSQEFVNTAQAVEEDGNGNRTRA
jgi:hypothetical protein